MNVTNSDNALWERNRKDDITASAVWPCNSPQADEMHLCPSRTNPWPDIIMFGSRKCYRELVVSNHVCLPCPFTIDALLTPNSGWFLCFANAMSCSPWSSGIVILPHIFCRPLSISLHLRIVIVCCGGLNLPVPMKQRIDMCLSWWATSTWPRGLNVSLSQSPNILVSSHAMWWLASGQVVRMISLTFLLMQGAMSCTKEELVGEMWWDVGITCECFGAPVCSHQC